MVFLSLVASHSQLDLETVAQISASADGLAAASVNGSAAINGAVVLATCNRFEVYADVDHVEDAAEHLVSELASSTDLSPDFLARRLTTLEGDPVIEHLFSVGAGLDSAVVGEREIAGQVRRALTQAQQEKTTTSNLTRLFQNATRAAKDVGSNTDLGTQGKSVVSVALDLAEELMDGDRAWAEQDVVLFGTGSYAGATMALLKERGVARISVYSSSGRAADFTAKRGGFPLTDELLPQALREADIIVGCSGGGHQLSRAELESLRVKNHPLVAIDMALTHDFDPTLAQLPQVELITLESVRMAAPTEQAMAVHAASRIVKNATAEFAAAQRGTRSGLRNCRTAPAHQGGFGCRDRQGPCPARLPAPRQKKLSLPCAAWCASCCTCLRSAPANWQAKAAPANTSRLWKPSTALSSPSPSLQCRSRHNPKPGARQSQKPKPRRKSTFPPVYFHFPDRSM